MPLMSTQYYLQGLLNGLVVPGVGKPLVAYVTPPIVDKLSGPKAYVWGGTLAVSRQSGNRGPAGAAGFKKLMWDADVWLIYLTNPNDASVDTEFPQVVDAVMAQLWSTRIPLWITALGVPIPPPVTDPPAGASQVLEIGEEFRMEYSPVHTPASNRMLFYSARLSLQIYEAVQA